MPIIGRHVLARTAVPVLVVAMLSGCGNIQNLPSAFTPGSSVDDIDGRFIDTAGKARIDYSSQVRNRKEIADKADPKTTFPGEAHIGLVDHSRLLPAQTIIYDPMVESFIQGIVTKLLEGWPGQKPDIRIAFVADTPDMPFEAEAGSDGTMFFGMSAIRDVESTDELTFKVSHELAHILMNHTVRVAQEKTGQEMRGAGMVGALLANSAGTTSANAQSVAGTNNEIVLAMAGAEILFSKVLSPAFSRQQEREADLLGTDMMVKAGYSSRAIEFVMQRLHDQEQKMLEAKKKVREAELAAQKQAVAAEAQARGEKTTISSAGLTSSLGSGLSDLFDQIGATHPEAEDRRKDLNTYIRREYKREMMIFRSLRTEEYQRFKLAVADGPLMRRQFTVMAEGFISGGDLDKAHTFALRALANARDPAPEARLQLYRIRMMQADKTGRAKWRGEAIQHLEIAWKGPEATPAIATALAGEYTRGKRYDGAETVLAEAGGRFHPSLFFPDRIRNFVAANRRAGVFSTAFQCDQDPTPPPVRRECRNAIPQHWQDDYAAFVVEQKAEQDRRRAKAEAARLE